MSKYTAPQAFSEAPRPPFKLSGRATIKHLNVRKEGPENEQSLAVDVKLQLPRIDRTLCDYFDPALSSFLWRGDTDALIVRNDFLAPVAYMHTISSASVMIDLHSFVGAEVKKFSIQPKDGGVIDLVCSVTVYPTADEVAELAKRVQDDVTISVEGPPDLFAGEADPPPHTASSIAKNDDSSSPDPLFEQARTLVTQSGKASISYTQRMLKIGYNRAAKLLEALEVAGVVGPLQASGMREVLTEATPA